MGQSSSKQRLSAIKKNVEQIAEKIRTGELADDDRNRSHDVLVDYIKELKLVHGKSSKASRIRKVETAIIAALQDLATLEEDPHLKTKCLLTLHDIEDDMKTLNEALSNQNFANERAVVTKCRRRISLVENIDREVDEKRNELLNAVNNFELILSEKEYEENLKQFEERHHESKVDLKRFVGVSDSGSYKKQKELLLRLKEEVNHVAEVSEKITARKNYLLFNVENNLSALESKVRENENKVRKQIEDTYDSNSRHNSIEHVINCYNNFESSWPVICRPEEVEDVRRKLTQLRTKIDRKLKLFEENNESTVVDEVDAVSISPIKEIQMVIEDIREQILHSAYNQESQLYHNFKNKLNHSKMKLESGTFTGEGDAKLAHSVSIKLEEVLNLLESNVSHRKSTTEAQLSDLTSVCAHVNQLGAKMRQPTSNPESYKSIENQLLEYWCHVNKMAIPFTKSDVCQMRDYVVIQIESYLSNLEKLKTSHPDKEIPSGLLWSDL